MAAERTPVLRKPTPAEELAKLHPVERFLYRMFEFMSSVKLALFLMCWLIIELSIGTFVEAQVNTGAAKYFIYSHWRFYLLLALLGLTILCAALIRFPWKRYQTGFLVTHSGLLLLLIGSVLTYRGNLDALMSVPEGQTESKYFDPDAEQLVIGYMDAAGKFQKQSIPVEFGPYTWGHKLFGKIPWRKDHTETFTLANGMTATIKKFYANCVAERGYIPADSGPPAVQFRLFHPDRIDLSQWLSTDPKTGIGRFALPMGEVVLWDVPTQEDLEHFVNAVPKKGAESGETGWLGYSHAGKHHIFDVDQLKKGPIDLPGTSAKVELVEYYPNARVKPGGGGLVSEGNDPANPTLKLKVTDSGKSADYYVFGKHPELNQAALGRVGREHMFSFYPAVGSAVIQLVATPEGKLGYRAFGMQGLVASEIVETGKKYPTIAGWTFEPKKILAAAKPEVTLYPRPLKRGKAGEPGVVVEIESGNNKFETSLARGMRAPGKVGDRQVVVGYDIQELTLPFQIRLDEFEEPKNPGTDQAAMFTSKVTLFDKSQNFEKQIAITMNEPLRYTGSDGVPYTLYQSGIDRSTGSPISTYTVAHDPGLIIKYVGLITLGTGIVLMFWLGGYFKKSPKPVATTNNKKKTQKAKEAVLT